ncbi:MAG: excalibur calcium-binding domain-containing protein [Chloroflexi bacterium]|nr:excalibur calcium-binding domain-containing protein [Chloroflexota bacterium]
MGDNQGFPWPYSFLSGMARGGKGARWRWRQAQDFFLAAGGPNGDRQRLDSDGDGVACESLPGAP